MAAKKEAKQAFEESLRPKANTGTWPTQTQLDIASTVRQKGGSALSGLLKVDGGVTAAPENKGGLVRVPVARVEKTGSTGTAPEAKQVTPARYRARKY